MGGWIFRKVGQLPLKTFLKERGHLAEVEYALSACLVRI